MSEAKHTPGPWDVGGNSRAPTITSNAGTICDLLNKQPEPERAANARLIAAAPNTLAALRVVEYAFSTLLAEGWDAMTAKEKAELHCMILDTIREATGGA